MYIQNVKMFAENLSRKPSISQDQNKYNNGSKAFVPKAFFVFD